MYLASVMIVLHEENRNSILTVKLVSSKFASCSLLCTAVLLVTYLGQSNKKCCSLSITLRLHLILRVDHRANF